MKRLLTKSLLASLGIIFVVGSWNALQSLAASAVNITATVNPVCDNGVIESGEQCDGSNLGGASCVSLGFSGGTLSCNSNCTFNTSQCTSGGGGGGGGGGYIPPPPETRVIFSGRAYPKSAITILKDAQIVATTITGEDANFLVSLSGLSGGNYIFSLYAEDNQGIRSSLLTFPVSVTSGATTNVSGIFIAPTIAVDKSEVKRGDNIAIFGQSAPQADIVISVTSGEEFFGKTVSDKAGIYLFNFDSTFLDFGTHYTKSKASIGNQAVSNFSNVISFKVGTKNVPARLPQKCPVKGDLNSDCRVNLVDFSIAAYWYKRPNPPVAVDLNGDRKIDLIDFSIMAFYWTG
jgi:hypothetical protein